ncbi:MULTISPECIES: hypothetical protein [Gordonia]|uniref:Uncharacterized protein n=1 Tax=Gordonia terrae TaxID=2055 RepID=A0A2I1R362_9ACTN|nr:MULTISPECIES: hypothetical protein [Gordonia]PKZ63563.1 hypothetical protein CYJ73_21100 [Gordonia terrae]PZU02815.1 MAG: hypothetical protein DI630_06790 [Gordonia sp. (in: high G+C Gram-positive bacteria)]QIK50312.1 hypothetical protein G8C36_23645 [Gordonia terrae]WGJ88238.1 hypothetical protein QAD21_24975 [Gordonia sp. SMJS1]
MPTKRRLPAAIITAAAAAAMVLVAGCGDDAPDSRSAKAISPSTVPSAEADLDAIVLGWGQKLDPNEITHPAPDDLEVTCTGRDDQLKVKITDTNGWKILLAHGSQQMRVENADRGLEADLDAAKIPTPTPQIDWSQPNQVDIAAHAIVPDTWTSPYGPGQQFHLSAHIDCA